MSIYFYLFLFLCSVFITYIAIKVSIKLQFLAKVQSRSSHTIPTPHAGGIAISIVWFVGISILFYTNKIDTTLYSALMLGIVISVLGFLDDIYELKASTRILWQFFVSFVLIYLFGGVDFGLFGVFDNIVAVLLIVWFINLYNFMDGINAYAGFEAVFISISGYVLFQDEVFLVLIASVCGFLVFNTIKAKIFMGDIGSTLLGYNIAVFAIYYTSTMHYTSLWIWLVLFALFFVDASYTLCRRILQKQNPTKPHKTHIYQILSQKLDSHLVVVGIGMLINLLLFCIVWLVYNLV